AGRSRRRCRSGRRRADALRGLIMSRARVAAVALAVLATAGCTSTVAGSPVALGSAQEDRELVTEYFTELNEAGKEGAATQRDFLRRTQHPDFTDRQCQLGELTLRIEPAMS